MVKTKKKLIGCDDGLTSSLYIYNHGAWFSKHGNRYNYKENKLVNILTMSNVYQRNNVKI